MWDGCLASFTGDMPRGSQWLLVYWRKQPLLPVIPDDLPKTMRNTALSREHGHALARLRTSAWMLSFCSPQQSLKPLSVQRRILDCVESAPSYFGRVPSSPMMAMSPVTSANQTASGATNSPTPIIAMPATVVGCGGHCRT